MTVRTRIAPSPTGDMHVGSLATVLKDLAWAHKHGGSFVLRIEDTDKEREVPGGVAAIMQILHDYGLEWDEGPGKGGPYGPYLQSERLPLYQEKAQELVAAGQAYYCFCSRQRLEELRDRQRQQKIPPKYDRHCCQLREDDIQAKIKAGEPYVIRLKVPAHQEIVFEDLIRGQIKVMSDILDDQVLIKSDGYPTYHLAVVVDDHAMQISHIIRGEEWISSTPKHVLLYQAFKWPLPVFAHIPVFLNPDGKGKMSKRKGTVSARSFLDRGYLPEAMLNFLMILGWSPQDQREIISLDEYIKEFDLHDISKGSVVFDLKKLDWLNGIYIRKLSLDQLKSRIVSYLPDDFPLSRLDQILPLVSDRLVKLSDIGELTDFFYRQIEPDVKSLLKKGYQDLVVNQLQETLGELSGLSSWQSQGIEQMVRNLQVKNDWSKKQYFMMLRTAVTAKQATPPLFETMQVLGMELTIQRLKQALKLVGEIHD